MMEEQPQQVMAEELMQLARLDELLLAAEGEGDALRCELDATLQAGATAVAREQGGDAAAAAAAAASSFTEPFQRAGPLLAGAAASRRVPELFVEDEREHPLGDGAAAPRLGESWLRHSAGGAPEVPEAERAAIIAELRQQLEQLGPAQHARRDALLPLLAPLVPLAELWRTCVAWRARAPGAVQLPAEASAAAVAAAFAVSADATLGVLVQDLGLLRSFAAGPAAMQRGGAQPLGPLGLSGTQLADELVGTRAVEAFGIAMGRLRAVAAAAKAQGDVASSVAAVDAAVCCHAALFDMACRGGAILREAGLAAAEPTDDEHPVGSSAAAGQLTETPRESLVPVPTPSSVKTPSAITFRELGPPADAARMDAPDALTLPGPSTGGVIWPAGWLNQRDGQAVWLAGAAGWALSGRAGTPGEDGPDGEGTATAEDSAAVLRLCRLVGALHHSRPGLPWLPPSVRDAFATGAAAWLTRTFLGGGATERGPPPRQQSAPIGTVASGSSVQKLADLACGCAVATTLAEDNSRCDASLVASMLKAYRAEATRIASDQASALRTTILADLDNGQHWRSHRPFLPNKSDEAEARCSYAVLMWRFSLTALEHDISQAAAAAAPAAKTETETAAIIDEDAAGAGVVAIGSSSLVGSLPWTIVADVIAPLLVHSLGSIVNRYVRLTFTRARVFQLQTDALCVATIVWDFRQRLFASSDAGGGGGGGHLDHWCAEMDELCGLLLRSVAVLTAPLPIVLDWLNRYLDNNSGDQTRDQPSVGQQQPGAAESSLGSPWCKLPWLGLLPVDLTRAQHWNRRSSGPRTDFDPVTEMSKLTSGGHPGEAWDLSSQPWFHKRSETVPWSALLHHGSDPGGGDDGRAGSPAPLGLELGGMLGLLRRRTELREGDFPALTEQEELLTATLREAIQALAAMAEAEGDASGATLPEPEHPKFVKAFSDDDY